MKHHMRISVSKKSPSGGVLSYRRVSVRERLLRFLFGEKNHLTIIVPDDSVDEVDIKQTGGESREGSAPA